MGSEPQKLFANLKHRTVTRKCIESGVEFEVNQTLYGDLWFPEIKYCDEVLERMKKEDDERLRIEAEKKREAEILDWCEDNIPPYYAADLNKSYKLDWPKVEKAIQWNRGNMLLMGKTRRGKTRSVYEIAKKFAHLKPVIMTAEKLARTLASSLSKSASLHEEKLNELKDTKLLLVDDLGKEGDTKRTQSDFFEIINYRLEQNLPTIVTTNYNGAELLERLPDKELAIPLVARLREYKIIEFI